MSMLTSCGIRTAFALLLMVVGLAPAASAVTSEFSILLNTDVSPASGCDVPTAAGVFQGVEQILITTVETTGTNTAQVTQIERQVCTNPATDTFGPRILVDGTDRPVGVGLGTGGSDVVETYFPFSALPVPPPNGPKVIRVGATGVNLTTGGTADALLTGSPGNQPINVLLAALTVADVPTLSEWGLIFLGLVLAVAAVAMLKRRSAVAFLIAMVLLTGAGIAWAAASDLNGNTLAEWAGAHLADDPAGDAPEGADILALFGMADGGTARIYFRLDVDLQFVVAPIANDDNYTTPSGTPLNVTAPGVLGNDTVNGATITAFDATSANGGTVVLNANGSFTYTPPAGFSNNTDTFTYTLTNAAGTDTATVSVAVTNQPPVAVDDVATVAEDAPATAVNVLANDTDPESDPFTIASVTQPANGTVVITGGGTGLTYQPNPNYCNTPPGATLDTFTYTLTPGNDTATVTMTVTCVDDAPVANDDAATVAEDAPATAVNVLANDTDVEGDPFTITSVTQPTNGTVAITGGGTGLTYQPNPNYCNTPPGTTLDTFTYTLTPGGDSATVTMTVTCDDDPPVAVDDAATVAEDDPATAVPVLANDTDPDGGPISITSVTQPANGTVVITGGGTGLTYQPNANYCNTPPGTTLDTFTYTLTPGGDSATVTMTVTCQDDAPVAVDDAATVAEDAPATAVPVLANDTDTDGGPISITSVTQPANGTVVITGGGTGLTYQPNANYCNTPPGTTLDTFTYTLTPGGDTATVTMTVTCDDDPPTAVNDAATVAEDSGANTINVQANDTDVDGGPISITSVTQPANGTVVITNGGADLTYTPNANYCNSVSGVPDTFTYTLTPGGSSATVTVTVTCVDDAPVAVPDAATVNEDSGANTINVLANDTDIDAGPISVTSVTQPANGTVVITNGGADLTYTPNADYCNNPPGTTDTFNYTLTPGGSTTTVSVSVTCLNDGPVIDLDANDDKGTGGSDFAVTFTEGEAAKLIEDPLDATVTDVDSATLASLTVTITNLFDTGFETLAADTTGTAIIANYATVPGAPGTGTLTLTGPDTVANFQQVLRTITYVNTSNAPNDTTARRIEFVANDGATNGNTAVSTVTVVSVDTAPTAVNDAATVNEDSGANTIDVLANDTDPDGGPISIQSVTQPTNGTVVITNGGADLTYQPDANFCTPGAPVTFTYTLTPGGSTATVSVTVTCVDDNPVAVADAATVAEDSGANTINVLANDTDADGGPISITSVTQPTNGTVVITNGGADLTYAPNANYCNSVSGVPDTFTYTLTPGGSVATVSVTVTCVDDNPVAVADAATVLEDSGATAIDVLANDTDVDGGPISITSVTQPAGGTVVITGGGTGLTYQPNANFCTPGAPDTFTYTLTPGGSSTTVSVTVTCVDDPPVAVADAATVIEDSGANTINVQANDTDVDGGTNTITGVTQPANGTVVITNGGADLTYAPNANYCNNPPGTTLETFTYTLTPGGSSTTVTVTVTCVNDPPVLATNPITYTTPGNTQLHVAGATLAGVASWPDAQSALTKSGPSDIDGPGPLEVVAASGSSTNGGSFSISTNGSFTYVPPVGFTGTDSFTYAVTDNGAPAATVTGTINITVGQRVWYIHNVIDANNAAGGDGRSNNAFDSIAAFNAATTNDGDIIFIFEGNTAATPLTGSISLRNGQKLWGQGIALNVPGFATPLAGATNRPRIRTTTASTDVVSVPATAGNRNNVEIRGLDLEATGATSNAIDITSSGANNVSVTINTNNVRGATAEGIDVNANSTGTATIAIHDNTLTSNGTAIDITRTAGTLVITAFDDNVILGDTNGAGIIVNGPATFDATPGGALDSVSGGVTVIGASGNAIGGAGLSLGTITGALDFADLDVFAGTSGVVIAGTGAFTGAAGTRVTVPNGLGIVQAGNGPGVDVSNATLDLRLSALTISASPTTGVSLVNVSDATVAPTDAFFSAGSGSSITNVTGTDFNVDGGNATVSYAGTINNTAGRSVAVQNRTGDSVTFANTSTITDNGTGILVNANAAGAVTDFLGTLTMSTGANAAFTATSGGTLRVRGTANTIATTTGMALNVTNTTIGGGGVAPETGLRFRSISAGTAASGPASGIVLNNTGALGSLTVTGTGGAGSGGTIQRTTSHGVSLTNTLHPSFTSMLILNTGGSGVKGTQVTNFTFVNGTIDNSGTALGVDESNIAFNNNSGGTENNLSGTLTVTGNTLTNAYYHGVDIFNYSGTLSDVNISNNTITSTTSTATSKGSGVRLIAFGSASTVANVTKATISNNIVSNFPSGAGIQAQGGNANAAGAAGIFGTAGSGTNVIAITGNRIAGASAANRIGTQAILAVVNGKGQGNFDISDNGTVANPITNITGTAIAQSSLGSAVVTSIIDNNVIVANNLVGANGIGAGTSQTFSSADTPSLTVTITGNTISQTDGNGILATARDATGILRAKIQNNTVAAPLGGVRPGIRVDAGNGVSIDDAVCLNISGNTSAGSGGSQGIGLRKQGAVSTTNDFGVNGMAATSTPGVETYVNGLNPAGGSTLLISATSGFSNCSLP